MVYPENLILSAGNQNATINEIKTLFSLRWKIPHTCVSGKNRFHAVTG